MDTIIFWSVETGVLQLDTSTVSPISINKIKYTSLLIHRICTDEGKDVDT